MKVHDLPVPAQHAAYWAFRAALTIPMLGSVPTVMRSARSIGSALSRSRLGAKHMARARSHLEVAFGDWDESRREEVARGSIEHLTALSAEILLSPRLLTNDAWTRHIRFGDIKQVLHKLLDPRPLILITGHCGNWEVLGYTVGLLGFPIHALYRPLDLKPLDRWVRETRQRRGLSLVDKFGAVERLPGLVAQGERIAFVADQNGGDRGLFVPYFGRLASAYKSVGLLALHTRASVVVGQARRIHPWSVPAPERSAFYSHADAFAFSIEIEDVIEPEDYFERPDPLFYLTARYRLGIERMIRRQPEDYLWMHRSWRSRPRHERDDKPFPESLRRKLLELPWMDEASVEALVDRSDRDRAILRELGTHRLP